MPLPSLPLMQGTLDLLVLRTLNARPMHGYGIATLVHEQTGGELAIEDAALYQALHRLDRQGLVAAEWGPSENNRRARYYTIRPPDESGCGSRRRTGGVTHGRLRRSCKEREPVTPREPRRPFWYLRRPRHKSARRRR